MVGCRGIGPSSYKSSLYPAQGIRPRFAACRSLTVATYLAFRSNSKPDDLARPTAPPRPGPLRFAAKAFGSPTHSGRLMPLHASRAWAHGPLRGSFEQSGMAAHTVVRCYPECGSCRALPSMTGPLSSESIAVRSRSSVLPFLGNLRSGVPRAGSFLREPGHKALGQPSIRVGGAEHHMLCTRKRVYWKLLGNRPI
jgi:hypothetical protein